MSSGTREVHCPHLPANSPLLAAVTFPNALVTTWTYEATRHLVDQVEDTVGATTVSQYDYANDTIGRRSGVQKSGTAFTATDTIIWGYDNRSQVTSAVAANDATYAYDPIGNRTTYVTKETGTPVTTGYMANQLNQYTAITSRTDPAYDDDGQPSAARRPTRRKERSERPVGAATFMTLLPAAAGDWTLAWDGENRLASAESATKRLEFVYDHMDRRIERRTYEGAPGDWTLAEPRRFLYDGWHLIAEFVMDGAALSLDRTHLWGLDLSQSIQGAGGVGGLLRTSEHGATVTAYYPTYDANGNVSEHLDSGGAVAAHYEYSPFGKSATATGTKAVDFLFRFSGKHLDDVTGLYCYGYRHCSPDLGRWASRDLLGECGGIGLYIHVSNSQRDMMEFLGLINPLVCERFTENGKPDGAKITPEFLEASCTASAAKIENNAKLRKCVEDRCESKGVDEQPFVDCGSRCDPERCKEERTLLGTTPTWDPNVSGKSNKNHITLCVKNLQESPWSIGDVLVHEFAHLCGWGDDHPPGFGVPDWPRGDDGKTDWTTTCNKPEYKDYWKCRELREKAGK